MTWTRMGAPGVLVAVLIGLAACAGAPGAQPPASQASAAPTPVAAGTRAIKPADGAGLPRCATAELAASLGEGGAAAGSVYRPLILGSR